MLLLSIDPGLCLGWSIFKDGRLTHAGMVRGKDWREVLQNLPACGVDEVVCEDQFMVRTSRVKFSSVLLLGRIVGGAFLKYMPAKFSLVKPHQWKHNTPKEITTRRTRARLDESEVECLDSVLCAYPKSIHHNLYDSVGIGLYWLKR